MPIAYCVSYMYIDACELPTPRRRPTQKKKKAFPVYVTRAFQHARPPRTTTIRYILLISIGRRHRYVQLIGKQYLVLSPSVSLRFIFSFTFYISSSARRSIYDCCYEQTAQVVKGTRIYIYIPVYSV